MTKQRAVKLYPKRRFSQNFLKHKGVLKRIVEWAGVDNEIVMEIGAGKGTLTRELAARAKRIYAVEIDHDLVGVLHELALSNIIPVHEDFLRISLCKFEPLTIVGNIPYSITTQIIEKLIEERQFIKQAVLTVQKEYGDRILARPKDPEYSSISIYVQYHFEVQKGFVIPARFFTPAPRVNSMVIRLRRKEPLFPLASGASFFNFVQGIFKYRRKSMRNALRYSLARQPEGLDKELLLRRPQELSIEEFHSLYRVLFPNAG